MCGIVGLFAKTGTIQEQLGQHLGAMLVQMTDRGPDSAGIAVYRNTVTTEQSKLVVLAGTDAYDWQSMTQQLQQDFNDSVSLEIVINHAVIGATTSAQEMAEWIYRYDPTLRLNSSGTTIEIYKEKGLPVDVMNRFNITEFSGTHALGHTRMATESAVTTEHSHPFSTGEDLCLVHNGSLCNHNRLRDDLIKRGVHFATDNDSEVAAGYLTWRLREGDSLEEALHSALKDLDGFFTFAIGTRDGFAVIRDPIACKPAVIAESDDWVAMASEYRAIAELPGAELAECWEPEPGRVYSWSH